MLLSGVKGSSVAEDRMRCAREVFAKYPDIKELAQQYANWSPIDGKKVMADWLKQFDQIDGVWADGSQGVASALGGPRDSRRYRRWLNNQRDPNP